MPKKNIIIIAIVVIVVIIGLIVIFGGGKYGSPERTLKTMIKAMEEGDVDAYLNSLTEDSQKILIDSGIKEQEDAGSSLKESTEDYEDAGFKVIEKTKDKAVMGSEEEENAFLVFEKEKEGWKLDLEATFEKIIEESMPSGE